MARRVCLVKVANDFLDRFVALLPQGVQIAARAEQFAAASTILRLEGPGLPPWCAEPPDGGPYQHANVALALNGTVLFYPGHHAAESVGIYEKLVESYGKHN